MTDAGSQHVRLQAPYLEVVQKLSARAASVTTASPMPAASL